jgi:hypothetical protein
MSTNSRTKRTGLAVVVMTLLGTWAAGTQSSGDALERGFKNPPAFFQW